jgi:ABC-2 type transport system ATP-binding protein
MKFMKEAEKQEYRAINIKNVSKTFVKVRSLGEFIKNPFKLTKINAVKKVSLEVKYNELYGIIGANGAGKTTLVKMISTILIPDSGIIYVNTFDNKKEAEQVRYSIGLVYGDERTFFWSLTGRQNLNFFAALHNVPRKEIGAHVDDLLGIVGLRGMADFRIDTYSTGMKHLLAIARGLLGNPQILILDEPTSGVDPVETETILNMIRYLVDREGKTVLWITHDLTSASRICDTVSVMDKGEIVHTINDVRKKKIDLMQVLKKYLTQLK